MQDPGSTAPSPPRSTSWRDSAWVLAAPAMLLALTVVAPAYNKAFTIDDTLFMRQAEHLISDPWHPTAFDIVWSEISARLSTIMPSGPVMAYLLLPAAILSNAGAGAEWAAHLVQWLMLLLGLFATAALCRRLGGSPLQAAASALFVASSPAVLGMAATVMPDVTAMALGTIGIERYLAFLQERRLRQGCLSGLLSAVALAAAVLSRSHTSLLLGPALLFALGDELLAPGADGSVFARLRVLLRPALWPRLWPLFLVPVLCGLGLFLTRDANTPQPSGVIVSTRLLLKLASIPRNLVGFLAALALTFPLIIPWWLLRREHLSRRLIYWGTGVAVVLFLILDFWRCLYVAPLVSITVACLVDITRNALMSRDRIRLALMTWLLLAVPVAFYVHFAPKYIVPSAPAAALLISLELLPAGEALKAAAWRWRRRILVGTVGVGSLLGLLIVRTDAAFADLGRRAAAELIAPRVQRGERVWFCGHWGFQWYAERAGGHPMVSEKPRPQPGDILVASLRADCHSESLPPRMVLLDSLEDKTTIGRTMAYEVGAGFFSNGAGLMPWLPSFLPLDRFDVFRILTPPPEPARPAQ